MVQVLEHRVDDLRLDVEGTGRVDVYRTKADGSQIFVRGIVINGPGRQEAA